MAMSPMQRVGPRRGLKFFWADKGFTKPGLYVWLFKRNLHIPFTGRRV
jgi:hypothetical protein